MRIAAALLVLATCMSHAVLLQRAATRAMRVAASAALVCLSLNGGAEVCRADTAAQENSLVSQLKAVKAAQVETQRTRIEKEEADLMTKELLYPDGKLIARGVVRLVPDAESAGDLKAFKTSFPYGYPDAVALDSAFADEQRYD